MSDQTPVQRFDPMLLIARSPWNAPFDPHAARIMSRSREQPRRAADEAHAEHAKKGTTDE